MAQFLSKSIEYFPPSSKIQNDVALEMFYSSVANSLLPSIIIQVHSKTLGVTESQQLQVFCIG